MRPINIFEKCSLFSNGLGVKNFYLRKKKYIYIYICIYIYLKFPSNFFEVIFLRYEKQMGKESRPSWGSFSKGFETKNAV